MGKYRDQANALFDAFEKELTEVAKEGGRDVRLRKKWRVGMMEAAKRRGLTVEQMIAEIRPGYIEAVRQANQVDTTKLSPDGKVGFSLWGPNIETRH